MLTPEILCQLTDLSRELTNVARNEIYLVKKEIAKDNFDSLNVISVLLMSIVIQTYGRVRTVLRT